MKRPVLTLALAILFSGALLQAQTHAQAPNPNQALTYPLAIKDAEAKARNKDYNGAVMAYQEAFKLATTPDQKSSVYYYIGHTYKMAGDIPKTVEFITLSSEVPGASDSRKAMAVMYLGDTYMGDRSKFDLARQWYAKAKSIPGAPVATKIRACYNTGRTYNTADTVPQARAAYEEILTIAGAGNNDKSDAHHAMALVSFSVKDLNQAQTDLKNSINFEGLTEERKQRALVGLAGIAKSTGRYQEAATAYEELLASKTLIATYRGQIQFQLGDTYVALKNPDKAKAHFEAVLTEASASAELKKSSQAQLDKLSGKNPAPAPAKAPAPAVKAPAAAKTTQPAATQPAR